MDYLFDLNQNKIVLMENDYLREVKSVSICLQRKQRKIGKCVLKISKREKKVSLSHCHWKYNKSNGKFWLFASREWVQIQFDFQHQNNNQQKMKQIQVKQFRKKEFSRAIELNFNKKSLFIYGNQRRIRVKIIFIVEKQDNDILSNIL
ncbi:unnamed protein product [Paramecium sonneborni]|uniref:Uncharacterized protein n=1 Tax=Paramecium sonneborni TaxID=65129 RepID=A0A8S1PEQ1_9CILI|nr:unnamed protein product [Paramecium sonneborni]